jgi:hypothetical protein
MGQKRQPIEALTQESSNRFFCFSPYLFQRLPTQEYLQVIRQAAQKSFESLASQYLVDLGTYVVASYHKECGVII